ncbi:hypothetical protein Tsubulata_011321 [Turnera subulata]|uniref:Uncharacterized protein n=1 Tax=Turnera subulata TaxID=218843 RepID=A0A9Q0FXR8_9ROSI|nr:hypothetical protein Tsubulata_011321 [Turnera subulata]
MSSIEEERLVQMVHDFIESGTSPPMFPSSSNCLPVNHEAKYIALQEILEDVTEAESKVLESLSKHIRSKIDARKTTSLKKWLVLRLRMDGFNASICQTSWVTSLGCPAGDYEYIDVTLRDKNGDTVRLIVDIDFRSQFELARPTTLYKELTDALPSIFVGSEEKLNRIISLLCSAAKQSLKEKGLHVPPWRTNAYMQAKWLSDSRKVSAASSSSSSSSSNVVGYSRENWEAKNGFGMWAPPVVKPKRRDLGGGSGLSSQFSNMGINCC